MKEMKLVVYPNTHGKHADWQNTPCLACREDRIGDSKRLTDAELAAEHWKSRMHHLAGKSFEFIGSPELEDENALERERSLTLARFATHPHYDEVQE